MNILIWALAIVALALAALLFAGHLWTRRMARMAETQVPRAGKILPVKGGSIHYLDLGPRDATPLVLIHGLSGQLQHFTYAMTDLLTDEFRVIVLDRPGCGYSERHGAALAALPEQARMIGEFLDAMGIDQPVLVGHSLGGAVALAMALDRPERTGALALLAPATQFQTDSPDIFKGLEIRTEALRRFLGTTIAIPIARLTTDKVLSAAFQPDPVSFDFLDRAGAALGLRPQSFVAASEDLVALEASMPAQQRRYATDLTTPGGVLFGSDDAILPPALHGQSMRAHGLDYQELPGRGHMIPLTAPVECARFVRDVALTLV